MNVRLSRQTLQVLAAFLEGPQDWKYGYGISQSTGLKSGTLYPILMRLAERGLLETSWEASAAGKPPRHVYRLTASGFRLARDHSRTRFTLPVGDAAFGWVQG